MLKKSLFAISILLASSCFANEAQIKPDCPAVPVCANATNEDIAALFTRWNDSLKTGDAKEVAKNYASDAILLPTVSNQVRLTDAQRVDYFEHFLEGKPVGEINSSHILISCDDAIDVGTYTFKFANGSEVSGRYTFTYKWDGKNWLISSHHSSAMPETAPAAH